MKMIVLFLVGYFSYICIAYGQMDSEKPTTVDVITLKFLTPESEVSTDLGELNLSADISNGVIKNFKAHFTSPFFKLPYDYSVKTTDLISSPKSLVVQGFNLGSLSVKGMNSSGEGKLIFTPESWLLGPNIQKNIAIDLNKVGLKKIFAATIGGKLIKSAQIIVNENPANMSILSMTFSPPKLVSLKIDFLQCDGASISTYLFAYGTSEFINNAHCDFAKATLSEKLAVLRSIAYGILDDNQNTFLNSSNEMNIKNQILFRKILADLGKYHLSIDNLNESFEGDELDTSLYAFAKTGQFEFLSYLVNKLNKKIKMDSLLTITLQNLFQYNFIDNKVEKSLAAQNILQTIIQRNQSPKLNIAAIDIFDTFTTIVTGYNSNQSLHIFKTQENWQLRDKYKVGVAPLAIELLKFLKEQEGVDFQARDGEFGQTLKEMFYSTKEFYSKEDLKTINQLLAK